MITQPLRQPLNQREIGPRKKKSLDRVSKNRRIAPNQRGSFLPAVSNDKSLGIKSPYIQSPTARGQLGQNNFKAIRLTKHDLEIQPMMLQTITSPSDAIQNMKVHHSVRKVTMGMGQKSSSLDSGEQFMKHISVSNTSKKDISAKSKDGFSLASKSNSLSPAHKPQRQEVLLTEVLPGDQQQYQNAGFVPRNTSTILPHTANVFIKQHHSSNRVNLVQSRDSSSGRKKIDLSTQGSKKLEPDRISFDQESNNDEQQQLQSMFDPAMQKMLSIDQSPKTTRNGSINLPKLRSKIINATSNAAISYSIGVDAKVKAEMIMTKNSLFSNQSHLVVSEEDVAQQNLMMAQSAQKVRELFRPKEFATEQRSDKRIHLKRARDAKPKSIWLRRPSSALFTKYSRKFCTNLQVKASMTKPSKEMFHNASFSMPPTALQISPRQNLRTQRNHPNQDSIYTIGEVQNSSQILAYNKHNISSNMSGSDGSGGSRSNSNQLRSGLARPSYQDPTVAAEGKVTMGEGMVHRKQMTRAIEAMRLASLRQSRLKKQKVNRVCEDLMQIEKVQNDKGLEQFGRNHLKKLYSLDREFCTTGNTPKTQLQRHDKNFGMTMQSFSIGSQHPDNDSNYRGRFGNKGYSVQQNGSLTGQLNGSSGLNTGLVTPFKTSKQHRGGSIVLQNQRFQNDRQYSEQKQMDSYDQDHLMQEILEEHLDPSQGQIVVTLDGELGKSFIKYLASEEAQKTLIVDRDLLENTNSSKGNLLEQGITGTQKPILACHSPKQKFMRNAPQVDKRVGFTMTHSLGLTKKLSPITKMMHALPLSFLDQTSSSQPETAEDHDHDRDSLNTTVRQQDLRLMLSSGQTSTRGGGIKVEGAAGQSGVPYRQMITQVVPHVDNQMYEDQSIISHESAKIDKSRLNTGNVTTYAGGQNLQSDVDRAETEEQPQRKGKRPVRKLVNQQAINKKGQGMFERKGLELAMNQQVDVLYQSFGADSTKKPPYRKYTFHDGESRMQTGRQPTDRYNTGSGSQLRESFERKIVPLGARHIDLGSINSSRDGGEIPRIDIGSSSGDTKHSMIDVSTVGGGSHPHGGEDDGRGEQTQMGQIIHSPQIIAKGRKAIELRNATPTPPIDITMTNYAIDKEYLERKGSPTLKGGSSPPDTQSPQIRGKGTKVLLQQAQMDPNSFLHTQPIHFDNFHVQARPLAKTIYGKQYKQTQEKLQKAKRKMQLIAEQKATAKLMASLADELRPIASAAAQAQRQAIINEQYEEEQKQQSGDEAQTQMEFLPSQSPSRKNISPLTSNPRTTIGSMPADGNSVLAKYSKPYDIVDLQINSERGSSMVGGGAKRQSQDAQDSRITINLNDKDFSRTIVREDLEKSLPTASNRLGTGGTLNQTIPNEFTGGRGSPMLSEKETVMRLPQVGKAIAEEKEQEEKTRVGAQRGVQNSTIITEVSLKRSIGRKDKKSLSKSARKAQKAQKMTVVQNVHMDELLRNGQFIQEPLAQLPSVNIQNPLKTERVFPKFKGKSPIGSNKPNFLNRKKQQLQLNQMSMTNSENFPGSPPHNTNSRHPDKAITVLPLRQRYPSQIPQQSSQPQSQPQEIQQKVQVAFATPSGQLIGRAGFELLALLPRQTLGNTSRNPNDITMTLQIAQNFEQIAKYKANGIGSKDSAPAYVMISTPQMQMFDAQGQLMAANHHAQHGGMHPVHPSPQTHNTETSQPDLINGFGQQQNYTAQLMNKDDEKLSDKKSPSPISGESSPDMHLIEKDRLSAKRLKGDGANTSISHHQKSDQASITLQQQQQMSEKLMRSGFGSPDFVIAANEAASKAEGKATPVLTSQQLNQPSMMGSNVAKTPSI